MPVDAGTVRARLTGDARGFEAAFSRANTQLGRFSKTASRVGGQMTTGLTLPIIGLGLAIGNAGVEFERETTKINTLVGVAADQVEEWKGALKDMGPEVGRGPTELARALFVVTSAGERGANALNIVERAAKASAIGLGDTAEIARAVTSAMQAYKKEGLSAAEATDVLVATVREGNLEASSLAGALGRVLGIAAQAGVTFQQVGAFIATFTRLGVSAEESVTALRGILNAVIKPTSESEKALRRLGTSAAGLRDEIETKGLTATLIRLVEATKGESDALAELIPNVRALSGLLGTAGAQGDAFLDITKNIENAAGILDKGFNTVVATSAFQLDQMKARLERTRIALGLGLAPALNDVLRQLTPAIDAIGDLGDQFTKLPEPVRLTVVQLLAMLAVTGPLLLAIGKLGEAIVGLNAMFLKAGKKGNVLILLLLALGIATSRVAADWDAFRLDARIVWKDVQIIVLRAVEQILEGIHELSRSMRDLSQSGRKIPGVGRLFRDLDAELTDKSLGIGKKLDDLRGKIERFEIEQRALEGSAVATRLRDMLDPGVDEIAAEYQRLKSELDAALEEAGADLGGDGDGKAKKDPRAETIKSTTEALREQEVVFGRLSDRVISDSDKMAEEVSLLESAIRTFAAQEVAADEAVGAHGETLDELIDRYTRLRSRLQDLEAQEAKEEERQQRLASLLSRTRTEAQRFADDVDILWDALARGDIEVEEYIAALENLREETKSKGESWADDMKRIGSRAATDLARGFMEGSEEMMDAVIGVVFDIFEVALQNAMSDALKTGSPSRVMAKYGRDAVAGFNLGMTRHARTVEATSRSVADSAVAGAANVRGRGAGGGITDVQITTPVSVSTPDARGVYDLVRRNPRAFAGPVVREIARNGSLQRLLVGG